MSLSESHIASRTLNGSDPCRFFDQGALDEALSRNALLKALSASLLSSHPHLFSQVPVYVSSEDVAAIRQLVATVERVVRLEAYREVALAGAPEIARSIPKAKGVFFGYDFHITDQGPKLIEINTNAGGAFLNWALADAQRACCEQVTPFMAELSAHEELPNLWADMMTKESGRAVKHLAIVDVDPETQYLYPEFLLAQALFADAGFEVSVCDPAALVWDGSQLSYQSRRVDLVYNRLTDFYLESEPLFALRSAYLSGQVTVTPHPRAHALYADKHNLVTLTDADSLSALDVTPQDQAILLKHIPKTLPVTRENAAAMWSNRGGLFFKPACGFGSRAAYRGDKITRKVWDRVVDGDYVAQAIALPATRALHRQGSIARLKYDLRAYVYDGQVQSLCARLYEGQTTNFRTEAGGFATVFIAPDATLNCDRTGQLIRSDT